MMFRELARTSLIALTALLACAQTLPAEASVLDDIKNTVNNIQNKVNSIQTKVTAVQDQANVIKQDTGTAVDAIRAGLSGLAGDMRTEILDTITEVQDQVTEIKAERDAFSAHSTQFKSDLGKLLQALADLNTAVGGYTGIPVSMQFGQEVSLITLLPDRALAPLYVVLGDVNLGDLAAKLQSVTADMQALTDAASDATVTTLAVAPAAAATAPTVVPSSCTKVLTDPVGLAAKANAVTDVGAAARLLGQGLIASGYTGVSGKPVQIHGYVGIEIVNDRRKKWGQRLDGLGELLLAVSGAVTNKVRYCTILDASQKTLNEVIALENSLGSGASPILDELNQKVDVPVSSRASQASVDELRTSALQTGTTVDAINTKLTGLAGALGTGKIDLDVVDVSTSSSPGQRRWLLLPTSNGKPVTAALSGLWGISGRTGSAEDLIPNVQVVSMGTGLLEVTLPIHPGLDPSQAYQFVVQDTQSDAQGSRLVGSAYVAGYNHD